jgi:hypothetical protein
MIITENGERVIWLIIVFAISFVIGYWGTN